MANEKSHINLVWKILFIVLISFISGFLGSNLNQFIFSKTESASTRIKNYYEDENAVLVSPSTLRKRMDSLDNSFVLVDLRSSRNTIKNIS